MANLSNKVALITGASKGIGAGIAKHLASCGAQVAVNYASSKHGAEQVVAEIEKEGGKAFAIQCDISQPGEIDRLFKEVNSTLGTVDILVNNAGRFLTGPLASVDAKSYHHNFDTNVLGLLLTTQKFVEQCDSKGGSIINIGTAMIRSPMPFFLTYGASKAAQDYITKALAIELGPRNIRVNSVLPGLTETEGAIAVGAFQKESVDPIIERTPLGRTGLPNDIAPVVAFLASEEAGWVTGELLGATGGL